MFSSSRIRVSHIPLQTLPPPTSNVVENRTNRQQPQWEEQRNNNDDTKMCEVDRGCETLEVKFRLGGEPPDSWKLRGVDSSLQL